MSTPTVSIMKQIIFCTNESCDNPRFVKIEFSIEDLHRIAKVQSLVKDNNLFSAKIEILNFKLLDEGEDFDQPGEESDWRTDFATIIIYDHNFYFFCQNKWDSAYQIESEQITFEEVWSLFRPSKEYKPSTEEDKTYVLFGEEPCRIFMDEGFNAVVRRMKASYMGCGLCVFTKESTIADILQQAEGWCGYAFLTKKEYNKLSKL